MAKAASVLTGMIVLFGVSSATYANTVCIVTEVCEKCTEDADPGTKLRLYEQHCKDQANQKGYEFLSYHSGVVGQCDFIRTFTSDVKCEALGLKSAK